MKLSLLSTILLSFFTAACASKRVKKISVEDTDYAQCTTAKEYITTLEYMRSLKDVGSSEQQSQEIARKVSEGCDGAAKRFIKVTRVLMKAELGSRESIKAGIQMANSDDVKTKTFLTVFKMSFLKNYLDLDLASALKTAKSLSVDYKHEDGFVAGDFQNFVYFCTQSKSLDLPKPTCAKFSRRLSSVGYKYNKPIFKEFHKTFQFLISSKGPRMTTGDALHYAEKIVNQGPYASENFMAAYRYGSSQKGLKLSLKQAVDFASNISDVPNRNIASEKKTSK